MLVSSTTIMIKKVEKGNTLISGSVTGFLWQDYGTGKETPRGNPGDIGRAKKRQSESK